MKVANAFVVPARRGTVALFICPESFLFAVATSLVVTIVRTARTLARMEIDSSILALGAALAVGATILVITVADRAARPANRREWATALASAFLNCLLMCVAAVGIEKL